MLVLTPDDAGIAKAVEILRDGGVILHATETCYGIAGDLRSPAAVEKLFLIKNRPFNQPVSALFPSVEATLPYVEWSDEASSLAREHLPGPLTIILPLKKDAGLFPTPQGSPDSTVGIRVSPHPTAMALAMLAGFPISTTSANLHGEPNPYDAQRLIETFSKASITPDAVIDDGKLAYAEPSTVVRLEKNGITLVRKGSTRLQ